MAAQPLSEARASTEPDRTRICLAEESRLKSISTVLMRGVATEEQAKAEQGEPLGLYVHVPFCASTCDFCAFYQVHPTSDSVSGFMKSLAAEASLVDWGGAIST